MDKILLIPDVHGRKFWERAKEFPGLKVFLGDYLDPYQFEFDPDGKRSAYFGDEIVRYNDITEDLRIPAIKNFDEIIKFARSEKDRAVLLTGNHDLHYIYGNQNASRKDYRNWEAIHNIFEDNKDLFKRACQVGNLLLTHAGASNEWLACIEKLGLYKKGDESIADAINGMQDIDPIVMASSYRGGYDAYSGPVWLDYREIDAPYEGATMPLDIAQVFGHTMVPQEGKITTGNSGVWASIDSRRCFTVNPYLTDPKEIINSLEAF